MSEHIIRRLKEQTPYTSVLDGELMKEAAAEITRLRKAVKSAYYEGWQDNASIDDTEDRLHAEWEFSKACAAIRGEGK